jgi:TRAP-type C4-dicarboxylate transport system permease small subunit
MSVVRRAAYSDQAKIAHPGDVMSKLAITFGVLLVLLGLGLGAYTYSLPDVNRHSPTSFIPAIFGVLLLVAGVLALNPKLRMHAMHFAALVGLVGFAVPLFMVTKTLVTGADYHRAALGGQIAMGVLSAIFVALCVRSFIAARRARKSSESA